MTKQGSREDMETIQSYEESKRRLLQSLVHQFEVLDSENLMLIARPTRKHLEKMIKRGIFSHEFDLCRTDSQRATLKRQKQLFLQLIKHLADASHHRDDIIGTIRNILENSSQLLAYSQSRSASRAG